MLNSIITNQIIGFTKIIGLTHGVTCYVKEFQFQRCSPMLNLNFMLTAVTSVAELLPHYSRSILGESESNRLLIMPQNNKDLKAV
jgi:hypothetical protein